MKSPAVRTKTIVYRFEFADTNIRTSGKLVPQIQRRIRFGKCVMAFNQRAKGEIAQLTVQRGSSTSVAVDVIALRLSTRRTSTVQIWQSPTACAKRE